MITERELVELVDGLSIEELHYCVECGWITPTRVETRLRFMEVDVARIRFIREMRHDFNINDEAVPVLLSLVDQVHGLRHDLQLLARSIRGQPDDVRRAITDTCKGFARESPNKGDG